VQAIEGTTNLRLGYTVAAEMTLLGGEGSSSTLWIRLALWTQVSAVFMRGCMSCVGGAAWSWYSVPAPRDLFVSSTTLLDTTRTTHS
jgi:hypothetical protein